MFKEYPSCKRLDSEEIQGILECPVLYIEPKIDGANASIYLTDEQNLSGNRIRFGKRTAQINDTDKGFNGFAEWVDNNRSKFEKFFAEYPDVTIFGEWLIKHTIGYYRPNAYRQFYAYDAYDRRAGAFWDTQVRLNRFELFDILQVSPIAKIQGPIISPAQIETLHSYLEKNKFLIDDNEHFGEGIVIKGFSLDGVPFKNKFGHSHWAKLVRQEFKEKHAISMGLEEKILMQEPERVFCETFITPARVEKIKSKINDDKGTGWRSEYIGELLGRMYHDVFQEELKDFVKEKKVKEFNFGTMQKYCVYYTKQVLGL